ncbi:MAG: RNA-binding S4 domain-containing protein [Christensenellaceae bacterium]|jgi:ribosomal 50S subunit-recycling heat shock protein|nr:RNA-binding S4 domain-containing protein [Christensenellaceae bacterium]
MRLDKFLKVSRLIKRRSVANEACDVSRVLINGLPAKPSKEVKINDLISIRFGDKTVKFKVLEVPNGNVSKEKAESLYQLVVE